MQRMGLMAILRVYRSQKVMFSQACVKNSWLVYIPPGQIPHKAETPLPSRQTSLRHPPPRMATTVDGTHPTGMHSCYICVNIDTIQNAVETLTLTLIVCLHCLTPIPIPIPIEMESRTVSTGLTLIPIPIPMAIVPNLTLILVPIGWNFN